RSKSRSIVAPHTTAASQRLSLNAAPPISAPRRRGRGTSSRRVSGGGDARAAAPGRGGIRLRPACAAGSRRQSEEHTSELQSRFDLVCRLLLEKKKNKNELILLTQSLTRDH